jgi:hypothetical protein
MRHRVERTAPEGGNDLVDCPLWRGVDAYPLHYLGPDKGKPFPASPIDPGSPCENGYIEGFSGKLGNELLDGEIFYILKEAQALIEIWRRVCNMCRPPSSSCCRYPARETWLNSSGKMAMLQLYMWCTFWGADQDVRKSN